MIRLPGFLILCLLLGCSGCTSPTTFLHDGHRVALGLRDDQIQGFQFYINHHTVLYRVIDSDDPSSAKPDGAQSAKNPDADEPAAPAPDSSPDSASDPITSPDEGNVEEIVIRKNTPCIVFSVGPKSITVVLDEGGGILTFKTRVGWGKSLPTYDGYSLVAEKKDGTNYLQFRGKTYQIRTEPADAWPSLTLYEKTLDDLVKVKTLGGRKVGN
jgi:hypothetical protein